MKQMGFFFDQTRCTGCYSCSVACKDWNNIQAGVNWRKIEILEHGRFPKLFLAYLSISCNHCENPSCLKACPVEAITKRDSDGIVLVNPNKCIGKDECGAKCLKACPWDLPQFGNGKNPKMEKCNFCFERLEQGKQTICVEACPMYALDAGSLEELRVKYGDINEAEGFKYIKNIGPCVLFKPKLYKIQK
ncbi:MAG: 4Fe-4S dicluster domain-containing protein [Candidatus Hermodarchaeota archaeon]